MCFVLFVSILLHISCIVSDLGDKSDQVVESIKKPLDPDRCESCYGAESFKQK